MLDFYTTCMDCTNNNKFLWYVCPISVVMYELYGFHRALNASKFMLKLCASISMQNNSCTDCTTYSNMYHMNCNTWWKKCCWIHDSKSPWQFHPLVSPSSLFFLNLSSPLSLFINEMKKWCIFLRISFFLSSLWIWT